ncbi:MAG: AAA family ATPase [Planctomycetota bacterium]
MHALELPGYAIGEQVYASSNSLVYRARRERDGAKVYLKVLPEELPPPDKLTRLRRELRMTQAFDDPRVITAYGLERCDQRLVLVVEDFGGVSLDRCLHLSADGLVTRLEVALAAARALACVHAQGLIHKDVCPANLVWSRADRRLKVIDFGISTDLQHETPSALDPEAIEGTLSCLAPEQTGRMNRALDQRTDLYGLGATLYWLFTGAYPFSARDPLELVHAHLARVPSSPAALAPELPDPLCRIVLTLLAKSPEDRYQSAEGLAHDLAQCLVAARGQAPWPTRLRARDFSRSFSIPGRLYGRDAEVARLLGDFAAIGAGGKALTLVAGYSGIGKSALVQQVHEPILARRGQFAAGKFDQFRRDVPFAAMAQALQGLIQRVLGGSEQGLARWRERLSAALGAHGRLVVEVIPELELVIGPQPAVAPLKPLEAQNRFNKVFADLIRAFADEEHPLTVFLDDLQWADTPSLELIERLLTDDATRWLFLIGAYRDNEVGPGHPLVHVLRTLRERGARVSELSLGPLPREHAARLIADTLGCDVPEVEALTEVCLAKTQGNPFFLRRFLHAVHARGGFTLDPETGAWSWDQAAVRAAAITDNVVDLMSQAIRELPEPTQRALRLAACVGAELDLGTLAVVLERSPLEAAQDLRPALEQGLLVPRSGDYKFLLDNEGGPLGQPSRVIYRWLHDRVQQAAYELIPDAQRAEVHHRLGERLLAELPPGEREERLLEVVEHLNRGARLRTTTAARDALAELNLEAGCKAIAAVAFGTARKLLEAGLELLGPGCWERRYRLTLELHTEAARATLLIPDFAATERHFRAVGAHAREVFDRVRACEHWLTACQAQNQIARGLDDAFEVLHGLGYDVPRQAAEDDFPRYLARARAAIDGRDVDALEELPPNPDPREVAALRLMMIMAPLAYIGDPALFPLLGLEAVALSAQNGDAGPSAFAYSLYATLLAGVLGEYDDALRFGELAQRVVAKHGAGEYAGRVAYVPNCFIVFWTRHLRATRGPLLASYRLALENGDHEFAAWSIMKRTQQGFFLGLPLEESLREAEECVATCYRLEQGMSGHYAQATLQAMRGLRGQSADPCELVGEAFDERQALARYTAAAEAFGLCNLHVTKALLFYLWDRWEEAVDQEAQVAPWAAGMLSLYHSAVIELYAGLSHLALTRDAERRAEHLAAADASLARLAAWAEHGPENFAHKHALLAAERARCLGEPERAAALFAEAIAGAEAQGYLQEQALGEELLGRAWLERGDPARAGACLARARHLYGVWGAEAKVQQLQRKHADLDLAAPSRPGTRGGSASVQLGDLDVQTLLKATHAISSQVQREALLRTLLALVIENAGARRGVFVREAEGGPRVEAEGGEDGIDPSLDLPLDQAPAVPASVVNLVRRTREALVLDDALHDLRFAQDPALRARGARSVLCVPVEHQGKLVATLYLEHDLIPGAFTARRVHLLSLLVNQTAISLENARLYSAMESLVEQRTRELEAAQRELAASLRADKERAVAENRAKSFFLATMSHEIRTPLNTILGLIELCAEAELPPRFTDYVSKIRSASTSLLGIVQNVLDLSRIEAGRIDFAREPFALEDVFARLEALLLPAAEAKGLAFLLRLDPGLPARVRGDAVRLEQVLVNLAGNAVKFTPEGSVRVEAAPAGARVRFSVRDTGVGIPQAALPRLFEAFTQVDGSTTRSYDGSGLGLAIAMRLTELMGGTLRVESEVGQGSQFTLELPLEPAAAGPRAVAADALGPPSLARLRVLLVEDVEANRFVLEELLRRQGVEVDWAPSGAEALAALRPGSHDAVLMDVHMPGLDGFETTRRLRRRPELRGLPVIGVTADVLLGTRRRCLEAGMDDALSKPIDPAALVACLARCTGREGAPRPQPPPTPAQPTPDLRPLREALVELRALLDRRSFAARQAVRELRAAFPAGGGPALARLADAIHALDYRRAARRLDELAASQSIALTP